MLVALAALVTLGSHASAQTVTVNRCAAAKVRCVMGYTHVCGVAGVLGLFKCHQKATTKSRFVDQVCVNRTVDKITDCFRDAERNNDVCLTTNDVVAIQSKIEAFVTDAVEEITPGFPFPLTNLCAAGKQKSVAEATAAKLECFEDAFRRGGTVDPACFSKPEAQFTYAWAKLESNGGCLTEGDDAALEVKLDAFIADIVTALDP
jgi:hypothetical protein